MMNKATPVRIQLSRKRGFNLQEYSHQINGLPAINVARPSRYGNPYKVGVHGDAEECVRRFKKYWIVGIEIHSLRGKNLACWCGAGSTCHADYLLETANEQ